MVKVQFAFMAGIAILEVFMVALPADDLLEASENAVQSLFKSPWYNNILKLQKAVLFSLVPQKPVFISCFYIIPVLSLRYFCSYVSNALSIFTALRLVVNDDNES
ncbi:uncharacterized protein LOC143341746 [Colletes latitarsis]|uniref:uncharacterized protein LOC143341746 n=1 Tax=Colletes latitarsis TaxID=2605962 RepID=UPI0040367C3D